MKGVEASPEAWQRVARFVRERRELLYSSYEKAAQASGGKVSGSVWGNIERGKGANGLPLSPSRRSLTAICRVLRWTDNSIDQIIAGGEPVVLEEAVSEEADLAERVARLERLLEGVTESLAQIADRLGVAERPPHPEQP